MPARTGHTVVKLSDDRVMMFGGEDENADLFDDLHLFQDNQWFLVETTGDTPEARKGHEAWVTSNDKMMIMGGESVSGLLNDLWSYDPSQNTWIEETVTTSVPQARSRFGSTMCPNGNTIITGGELEETVYLGDTWEFSQTGEYMAIGNTGNPGFLQLADMLHPSWGHRMFFSNGFMIIAEVFFGGSQMHRFDIETLSWQVLNLTGAVPNYSPLAAAVDIGTGFCKFGGWSYVSDNSLGKIEGFQASNEGWYFEYESSTWVKLSDMPEAIFDFCAIYDEENQIIKMYGGMKADNTINDKVLVYHLTPTAIEENNLLPIEFKLMQNYPNPLIHQPLSVIQSRRLMH